MAGPPGRRLTARPDPRPRARRGALASVGVLCALALALAACTDEGGGAGSADGAPGSERGAAEGSALGPAAEGAAPLPVERTEVAGAVWEGRVAVLGGLLADGSATGRVDLYEPGGDAWSRGPDLPRPLHHAAAVAHDGRLWVIGGYTGGGGRWSAVAEVSSLGVGEDSWREEAPLASPRGALAAASDGERIVAAGGVDGGGDVLATTEVLRGGVWRAGPDLATAREHLAMTVAGGDLVAVAGRAGGLGTNRRSVEVLDLDGSGGPAASDPLGASGGWRAGGELARARGGIGAATLRGRPCVAGGEAPGGTIAEVECARGSGGPWEVVGSLRTPRHGLAVVALDGRLHVVGGGPRPGLTVSGAHEVLVPAPGGAAVGGGAPGGGAPRG